MQRHAARMVVALVALTLGASAASAQGSIQLERFRPSETPEGGFALSRPDDQGHMRVGAQLHLSYANDPLVYERNLGDAGTEDRSVVRHHLVGTLGVSLGLMDRFVVFAALPVNLLMDGDSDLPTGVPPADDFGLGDLAIGARARLLGEQGDLFGLAAQLRLTAPMGQGNYRGDDNLTFHPEVLAELRPGSLRFTLNLGARVRENQTFPGEVEIGDELTFGLGLTAPLYGDYQDPSAIRLDIHAQVFGASGFGDFFGREETPVEALAGLKLHHPSGWVAGLAGGGGVMRGFGAPDGRIVATVGWLQPVERAEEPEESAPTDTDGDGVNDDADGCPEEPEDADGFEDADGCPDLDNDGDGVADDADACPMDAEDADGFEDEDGCPDADNDGAGVADADDQCRDEPEDVDEHEDADGCPDPDNDGDGLMDGADRCPLEAGPAANDGCPDTDRDEDGVVDRLDNCPDEPGPAENQGCEERQRVRITEGSLEILDKVYFATNSDRIQRRSFRLLANVAQVLNNHPEIQHVRVEGHTDDRGPDDRNLELSQKRAEAVVAWLVERGEVAAERLEARGFGETQPIESNDTREGRAANRRVEFDIVEEGEAEADATEEDAEAGAEDTAEADAEASAEAEAEAEDTEAAQDREP